MIVMEMRNHQIVHLVPMGIHPIHVAGHPRSRPSGSIRQQLAHIGVITGIPIAHVHQQGGTIWEDHEIGFTSTRIDMMNLHLPLLPSGELLLLW